MSAPSPMTCQEVFDRLELYLDRELTAEEQRLVDEHLAVCEVCTREHRFEAAVLEDLKRKLRHLAAPPEVLRRIRAALDRAQPTGE